MNEQHTTGVDWQTDWRFMITLQKVKEKIGLKMKEVLRVSNLVIIQLEDEWGYNSETSVDI